MITWICVATDISEPKLRKLSDILNCSIFEAEGIMVSLWQWAAKGNTDNDGYVKYANETDIGNALKAKDSKTKLTGEDIVHALIKIGSIEVKDGLPLLIHDWTDNQSGMIRYNKTKEQDRERKRRRAEEEKRNRPEEPKMLSKPVILVEDIEANEPDPKPETEKEKKKRLAEEKYEANFRKVWDLYPRKDEKSGAYAAYKARLRSGYTEEELLAATQSYADMVKRDKTDRKFIKQGKTFFGPSTPFIDYIPFKPADGPKKPAGVESFKEFEEE